MTGCLTTRPRSSRMGIMVGWMRPGATVVVIACRQAGRHTKGAASRSVLWRLSARAQCLPAR